MSEKKPVYAQTAMSISSLSDVFARDRRTIAKVIRERDIPPATRGAYPTYRLGDVARALIEPGGKEASNMAPKDAKDFWDARLKEIEVNRREGELGSVIEFQRAFSVAVAVLCESLRSLPDKLERKAGITGKQAALAEEEINSALEFARQSMVAEFEGQSGKRMSS